MQTQIRARRAGRGFAASILIGALVVFAVLASRSLSESRVSTIPIPNAPGSTITGSTPGPTLVTTSPLPTKLTETEVRELAMSRLNAMADNAELMDQTTTPAQILSVDAITWGDLIEREPHAGAPVDGSADALRTVWLVRAQGTFLVARTPPGREPFAGKSGYLLIDDETGMYLGMGTP